MTHYLLFSGKGGVGKTSLSSAAAVALAQQGLKTLLVTTDPASNLGDVFGQPVGLEPQPIEGVEGLFVQAIDPKASLVAYKERALAPLRALFPETIVQAADEKLSGPCTEEVATFDQFIACLRSAAYDWVVFDTAPTGHTLRLLELPESWTVHISDSAMGSGQTCMGPVEALTASQQDYLAALKTLQDASLTTIVFVTRAARLPIDEMLRAADELRKLGISHHKAIINGVIPVEERSHPFAMRQWLRQQPFVETLPRDFDGPVCIMPLYAEEIHGVEIITQVGRDVANVLGL